MVEEDSFVAFMTESSLTTVSATVGGSASIAEVELATCHTMWIVDVSSCFETHTYGAAIVLFADVGVGNGGRGPRFTFRRCRRRRRLGRRRLVPCRDSRLRVWRLLLLLGVFPWCRCLIVFVRVGWIRLRGRRRLLWLILYG